MTMVVGFNTKKGGIMIADSRATWVYQTPYPTDVPDDRLQKIFPLTKKIAIGFAGDVLLANRIISRVKSLVKKKRHLEVPEKLAMDFPRIAKHEYKKYKAPIAFIIGAFLVSGKTKIWSYKYPKFERKEVDDGFDVIGSGEIVKDYLEKHQSEINNKSSDIKTLADYLQISLSGELGRQSISTVGGMLQIILIEPDGIKPLWYGFVDVDPDKPALSKSIEMKSGRWIQYDLTKDKNVPLITPSELLTDSPKRLNFHDYIPQLSKQIPKWHLTYFLTCLKAKVDVGTLEFEGVLTSIAKRKYPLSFNTLAAVGFWGSPGKIKIKFALEKDNKEVFIKEEEMEIEYLPEEKDLITPLSIDVNTAGPTMLKCYVNGQLLGRRAMYFHEITDQLTPQDSPQNFAQKVNDSMMNAQRKLQDDVVEKNKAELVYFTLCQNSTHESYYLKFEGQFMVNYWKSYPLPLKTHIATAFRMSKGKHKIEINLVDTMTRETSLIDTATIDSNSSFIISPIHGDILIKVPRPGIYFINAVVDGKRVGSIILASETDTARWSYTLPPQQQLEVTKGGLLSLLKRARQINS